MENRIKPGWVYILNREGFEENPIKNGEWINFRSVIPMGKIPVIPADLNIKIRPIKIPNSPDYSDTYTPEFLD